MPPTPPELMASLTAPAPPAATLTSLGRANAPYVDQLAQNPQYQHLQAEQTRLTDPTLSTSKSGIGQIHNPWARVPLRILDAIGSGLAPGLTMAIPGTQLHHQLLVRGNEANLGEMQKTAEEAAKRQLTAAQTAEMESRPELHQATLENAQLKLQSTQEKAEADRQSREKIAEARNKITSQLGTEKNKIALQKAGYRFNDQTGEMEPIPEGELSAAQRASIQLNSARDELVAANADYAKAKAANLPEQMNLARARIGQAQQNMQLRLGEFMMHAYGTDVQGNALPGAILTPEGTPIGTMNAANVRPTTASRGAAEQGEIIQNAGNDLISFVKKNRGTFGNIGSYLNQYANNTPISDPTAAAGIAKLESFFNLQPRMHGMRGKALVDAMGKAIGGLPKNPDALIAAIEATMGTAGIVRGVGTPHTAGAGGRPPVNQPVPTTAVPAKGKTYNPVTGKLE